jgi:polysaccharide pyruvyl transferase WcaK-like protein
VMVAKATGVPITTAPLGIGPFTSRQASKKTVQALTGSCLLVRDEASLAFCIRNGLSAQLAKDAGFRATEVIHFQLAEERPSFRKTRIGINIFEQPGSLHPAQTRLWWTDLLKTLAQAPVMLEAFCFHTDLFSDFSLAMECWLGAGLEPALVRPPPVDFRAACGQLSDFDVIVSARFHAIVIGNILHKTTFGIYDGDYYKHKMYAAADGFERSQVLTPTEWTASEAAKRVLGGASIDAHR